MSRRHITNALALAALLATGAAACTAQQQDQTVTAIADPTITTSIQAKYFMDTTVKGMAIDVDTYDGVVTLAGVVGSNAEKARAVELAQGTDGVVRVEDLLAVRPEGLPTAEQTGINPTVDTGWITTKIEAQYFLDPDVKGRNIEVLTATDGTVTLRGQVDSSEGRRDALQIARGTEGVRNVVDELTVGTGTTAEPAESDSAMEGAGDAWITTKVQARYFLDPDVKGRDIDVDTANGVVTLNGTVESAAVQREAVALARNIDGVVDVVDRLRVVPPVAPEADADDGNPVTDAWLTTKIQSRSFVDPDVSGLSIDVTTRDRVVTLEGVVESDREKALAEAIAKDTRGVRSVRNQLTVNAEGIRRP